MTGEAIVERAKELTLANKRMTNKGLKCSHASCTRPAKKKGFCPMHYSRHRAGFDMDAPPIIRPPRRKVRSDVGTKRGKAPSARQAQAVPPHGGSTALPAPQMSDRTAFRLRKLADIMGIPPAELVERIVAQWLGEL